MNEVQNAMRLLEESRKKTEAVIIAYCVAFRDSSPELKTQAAQHLMGCMDRYTARLAHVD